MLCGNLCPQISISLLKEKKSFFNQKNKIWTSDRLCMGATVHWRANEWWGECLGLWSSGNSPPLQMSYQRGQGTSMRGCSRAPWKLDLNFIQELWILESRLWLQILRLYCPLIWCSSCKRLISSLSSLANRYIFSQVGLVLYGSCSVWRGLSWQFILNKPRPNLLLLN